PRETVGRPNRHDREQGRFALQRAVRRLGAFTSFVRRYCSVTLASSRVAKLNRMATHAAVVRNAAFSWIRDERRDQLEIDAIRAIAAHPMAGVSVAGSSRRRRSGMDNPNRDQDKNVGGGGQSGQGGQGGQQQGGG